MDVFPREGRASYHYITGGCKDDAPLTVVVRDGVKAIRPNHRHVHFLPFDAGIHITEDDFHVPMRVTVELLLQPRVERFLLGIG